MMLKKAMLGIAGWWVGRRIIAIVDGELPPAPFIVSANHASYFDHFVIGYWLLMRGYPYPKFLSKAELFDTPLSAWFNRLGGGIPLSRGKVDTDAFEKAREVLENRGVFIVYAEGTRSRDGFLRSPRRGIASLAAQSGVPVVPVGLLGTNQIQPVGAKWPRRKRRVVLHAGTPIAAPTTGRVAEQAFVRETFSQVAGLTAQWPSFVAAPIGRQGHSRLAVDRLPRVDDAHQCIEDGFVADREAAEALYRRALLLVSGIRSPDAALARGRAHGQLALLARNPLGQLVHAFRSRRAIWRSLRHCPDSPLAWHVWAILLSQLPAWFGGDGQAAETGHRMAVALDADWPRGLQHLIELDIRLGRLSEAQRWIDHLMVIPPITDDDKIRRKTALELQARIQLATDARASA